MSLASPINWVAFERALVNWAMDAMPITACIWANQNAPQPQRPYAVLNMISGPAMLGWDDLQNSMVGNQVVSTVTGQRVVTVSVNVHSATSRPNESAEHILTIGQISLSVSRITDVLYRDAGIAVNDIGDITNLDAVEESAWASRAAMDLRLNLSAGIEAVEQNTFIETVEITGP